MGFGMVLGGVAKGLTAQQELAQRQQQLALQQQTLQSNQDYRNATLGLEQKRVDASTGAQAATQARTIYDGLLGNVKTVIQHGLEAGQDPAAIAKAIQPQVSYMQTLAPVAGIDVSAAANEIQSMLGSGIKAKGMTPTEHIGQIFSDFRAGKPLSKQDKALLDNYFKQQNPVNGMIQQELPGASPAPSSLVPDMPAGGGAPAGAGAPAAPVPPVPDALKGKGALWSPSKQRFYLPDGSVYNQQGVPVS